MDKVQRRQNNETCVKQRLFSWFDSYDIYYENGRRAYTVKGQLSWGHRLNIMDKDGRHIGTIKEKVLRLLPKFELYENGEYIGDVAKEFTLARCGQRLWMGLQYRGQKRK